MKKKDQDEPKNSSMMHSFKPVDWAHTTTIYEVNLRQYTQEGTINAFIPSLPRLRDMGIQTLWFMPITPIAEKNKKGSLGSYYACADYTAVSPEFGTLDDFKRLVKEAHAMGFKVIIDWVANHTGWDHKWTREHPDYYLKDSATADFKIASGMDDIIELDFNNPTLRKAMTEAMKFWVQSCDIDGFRCDLAFWVELDYWKEARKEIDAIKPLFWLGEFDELENPEYGEAFDASYTWSWMHKAKDFYQQRLPLDTLYKVLKRYDDLGDRGMRTWFTTNHDENSWNGTEYEKYGDMAITLAVFSSTWNGIPLLYSGQEIPNTRRLLFFEKDPLVWNNGITLDSFYRQLLLLKATHPALRGGDATVKTFRLATTKPKNIFAYLRQKGASNILVLLNWSAEPVQFELIDDKLKGLSFQTVLGTPVTINQTIDLRPWGYTVMESKNQ